MSTFNDINIDCVECGEEFRAKIWVAVHAVVDPELKELMLGGELNLVSCPGCGHVTYQDHFMIYQDPPAELIAYVYPEIQKREAEDLRKIMLSGFKEAQGGLPTNARIPYEPLLVFGLEALVERLHYENEIAMQSQIAEALCKENKLDILKLRPSIARRLESPRVLPHTSKNEMPSPKSIVEGIDRLLKIDPVLDLYTKLKETIQKDPAWSL